MGYKLVCVWNTNDPLKEGWYLVTKSVTKTISTVDKEWFNGKYWTQSTPDGNRYRDIIISDQILAWSELPEPYKGYTLDRTK